MTEEERYWDARQRGAAFADELTVRADRLIWGLVRAAFMGIFAGVALALILGAFMSSSSVVPKDSATAPYRICVIPAPSDPNACLKYE